MYSNASPLVLLAANKETHQDKRNVLASNTDVFLPEPIPSACGLYYAVFPAGICNSVLRISDTQSVHQQGTGIGICPGNVDTANTPDFHRTHSVSGQAVFPVTNQSHGETREPSQFLPRRVLGAADNHTQNTSCSQAP